MLLSIHNFPKCAVHTFAEGCGYSQGRVLSRHVDSTGADDGPLLSVHHQNNPNKHTQEMFLSFTLWFILLIQDYCAWRKQIMFFLFPTIHEPFSQDNNAGGLGFSCDT